MSKVNIGIDISKAKFDVALLEETGRYKTHAFDNNVSGFEAFHAWLQLTQCESFHLCMEATGTYSYPLARYLYQLGYQVSVVNPAKIKGFAQSELSRNKTDLSDAKLIARFCHCAHPKPFIPKPDVIYQLQALVTRLNNLGDAKQQELNRLDVADSITKPYIKASIKHLENQMNKIQIHIKKHIQSHPMLHAKSKLLTSIPGIADKTMATILAFIGNIEDFNSPKQLAAFVGLNPRQCISGSSVYKQTRLSKIGNRQLRKALYMPAIVAKRHNPIIKTFCERLAQNGKRPMQIIGAAMRKLLHIIFGVLKSGLPFNPTIDQQKA